MLGGMFGGGKSKYKTPGYTGDPTQAAAQGSQSSTSFGKGIRNLILMIAGGAAGAAGGAAAGGVTGGTEAGSLAGSVGSAGAAAPELGSLAGTSGGALASPGAIGAQGVTLDPSIAADAAHPAATNFLGQAKPFSSYSTMNNARPQDGMALFGSSQPSPAPSGSYLDRLTAGYLQGGPRGALTSLVSDPYGPGLVGGQGPNLYQLMNVSRSLSGTGQQQPYGQNGMSSQALLLDALRRRQQQIGQGTGGY